MLAVKLINRLASARSLLQPARGMHALSGMRAASSTGMMRVSPLMRTCALPAMLLRQPLAVQTTPSLLLGGARHKATHNSIKLRGRRLMCAADPAAQPLRVGVARSAHPGRVLCKPLPDRVMCAGTRSGRGVTP